MKIYLIHVKNLSLSLTSFQQSNSVSANHGRQNSFKFYNSTHIHGIKNSTRAITLFSTKKIVWKDIGKVEHVFTNSWGQIC